MNQNTRELWRGTLSMPAPPDILGSVEDGCECGRSLRVSVSGIQGCDTGVTDIPHHLQRGGGCGGTAFVLSDGGERGQVERARKRGHIPKFPFLRR